jgi:L-ascorbate metabolism protein UlaG (beta-lactamase superfamily)
MSASRLSSAALVAAGVALITAPAVAAQSHTFPADGGDVVITPFAGAGVQIEHRGAVIHVDPWSRGDYSAAAAADLVLITDTPNDHLDPALIGRLRTPRTVIVVPIEPERARDTGGSDRLRAVAPTELMQNGHARDFLLGPAGTRVTVEAVAMYDIIPGEPFHAPGEGNGYVVTVGGLRIYLAGVTECTPEMLAIRDIDIAFIPMNLPHGRMVPAVAAECVRRLAPRVVFPYHYRELPIDDFVSALRAGPIEVRLHNWYPAS